MKKLVLVAAATLVSFTTFGAIKTLSDSNETVVVQQQEKFKAISAEALPEAVKEALKTDFPKATLTQAYVNEKKEYKLELATQEKAMTLYANEKGEWIKR